MPAESFIIIPKAIVSWFVGQTLNHIKKSIGDIRKEEKLESAIAETVSAAIKIASPREGALGSKALANDIIEESSDLILNYVFRDGALINKTNIFDETRLRLASKFDVPDDDGIFGEVYSLTRNDFEQFFDRFLDALDSQLWLTEPLRQHRSDASSKFVEKTTSTTLEEIKETHQSVKDLKETLAETTLNRDEIDKEIKSRLSVIRQSRFFNGVDHKNSVKQFAEELIGGRLAKGSPAIRSDALSWSARFLSKIDIEFAQRCIAKIAHDFNADTLTVAKAFIDAENGKTGDALKALADTQTALANTAALQIQQSASAPKEALQWLSDAGLPFQDLDADGKFVALALNMDTEDWETAWQLVDEITDEDYNDSPILLFIRASLFLTQALPPEFRSVVLGAVPFNTRDFALSDTTDAIKFRNLAIEYFDKCAAAATQLQCFAAANIANEFSLWLKLRDPQSRSAAQESLLGILENGDNLRLAPMALDFGLPLNLEDLEARLNAATARMGGASAEIAGARFKLALRQKGPLEAAQYIDQFFDDIVEHLNSESVRMTQIELYLDAGSPEVARERLEAWRASDQPPPPVLDSYLIEKFQNSPKATIIDKAIKTYNETQSIPDLRALNALLENEGQWDRLAIYGPKAFEMTKDSNDAELAAAGYMRAGDFSSLISFFDVLPIPYDRTDQLYSFYGWSRYYNGDFKVALTVAKKLQSRRDNENDRQLEINALINSGDWDGLLSVIDRDWESRNSKDGAELLRLGTLAFTLNDPRAKTIIRAAADKSKDNPHVLAGAYMAASNNGWENDDDVGEWFKLAARQSSPEKGPFQTFKLADIPNIDPGWNDRVAKTIQQLRDLEIPMALGAKIRNQTLLEQTMMLSIANGDAAEIRSQSPIFSFSGHRPPTFIGDGISIILDPTSLITLYRLELLQTSIDRYKTVYIPHSTMPWLFDEQQRLQQFQRSQVARAEAIIDLVQKGQLTVWDKETRKISPLAVDVGNELASMLIAADGAETPSFVVRSAPVHRIGSLMEEVADLTGYSKVLVSCGAVVEKLFEQAQLTEDLRDSALTELSRKEQPWAEMPAITDGAELYLDDLSVNFLHDCGVLQLLSASGLVPIISQGALKEAQAWINRKKLLETTFVELGDIRRSICKHIEDGSVVCSPLPNITEDKTLDEPTPYIDAVLADAVDVSINDDRYFNVQKQIQHKDKIVPIGSSLDILFDLQNAAVIDEATHFQKLRQLRNARYCLVPISKQELLSYLEKASIQDGALRETAELKQIKAYLQFVRIDDFLRPSSQHPWLIAMIQTFISAIKHIWESDCDAEVASCRATWLVDALNIDSWSRFLSDDRTADERVATLREVALTSFTLPTSTTGDRRQAFFQWIEQQFLEGIERSDPTLFETLKANSREFLVQFLDRIEPKS